MPEKEFNLFCERTMKAPAKFSQVSHKLTYWNDAYAEKKNNRKARTKTKIFANSVDLHFTTGSIPANSFVFA